MRDDIECPYCEHPQEINHDEGYGFDENVMHQQHCESCDKYFTFTTSISYYYEAEKADCLNGGKHIWKEINTWHKEFTQMKCRTCNEERRLTEEE